MSSATTESPDRQREPAGCEHGAVQPVAHVDGAAPSVGQLRRQQVGLILHRHELSLGMFQTGRRELQGAARGPEVPGPARQILHRALEMVDADNRAASSGVEPTKNPNVIMSPSPFTVHGSLQ